MFFSSSSLSAISVVSSAYLRLLIFLLAILILACVCSGPAFLMMCRAYELNKQGDNIQPWRTPFPIGNQSVVPCPVLTVASWPTYRFLIGPVLDRNLVVQSQWWESERRKEANIPWVTQPAFALQRISQKRERDRQRERERERERKERKKERQGDQSSDGAKVF